MSKFKLFLYTQYIRKAYDKIIKYSNELQTKTALYQKYPY